MILKQPAVQLGALGRRKVNLMIGVLGVCQKVLGRALSPGRLEQPIAVERWRDARRKRDPGDEKRETDTASNAQNASLHGGLSALTNRRFKTESNA